LFGRRHWLKLLSHLPLRIVDEGALTATDDYLLGAICGAADGYVLNLDALVG
jgi:hypothetical protein